MKQIFQVLVYLTSNNYLIIGLRRTFSAESQRGLHEREDHHSVQPKGWLRQDNLVHAIGGGFCLLWFAHTGH